MKNKKAAGMTMTTTKTVVCGLTVRLKRCALASATWFLLLPTPQTIGQRRRLQEEKQEEEGEERVTRLVPGFATNCAGLYRSLPMRGGREGASGTWT